MSVQVEVRTSDEKKGKKIVLRGDWGEGKLYPQEK